MKRLVCTQLCFHRHRRWRPGATLAPLPGEKVPPYFVDPDAAPTPPPEPEEPKTLAELAKKQEAEEAILPENVAKKKAEKAIAPKPRSYKHGKQGARQRKSRSNV